MTVFRNLILLKANATDKLEKNMSNKKIYYLLTNGHIAKITKDYIRKQNKNYKANQHKFQKGITYGYNDYQSLENIL